MEQFPLSIRLLGAFEVRVRGEPLRPVRTRSVEWLLALLVLRHGREVSRSWLAGMLWPQSTEAQGHSNLRRNVLELRRALGAEASRLRSPTRAALFLDLTNVAADVIDFDAAIAAGDERSLQEAVSLYRGPLLEGCCEEWVLPEREARAEACLQALEMLADGAARRGDSAGALAHLLQAVTIDPLRDSVQRRRMQWLAASGDVPAALLTYREHRLRLHRELNVEPDVETTQLFQELRSGVRRGSDGTGRRGDGASRHGPNPPISPSPHLPVSPSPVAPLPRPLTALLGREQEVREVVQVVRASRLVTLIGGGGVGKTRLAIRVAEEAAGQFPDGVVFTELASLADPALLPVSLAATLGLQHAGRDRWADRELGSPEPESLMPALIGWLSTHPVLLVLDNCEHLIEAAAALAQALLEACPALRILATSRQRLGLTGETAWRVPSLPVPPAADEGLGSRVPSLESDRPRPETRDPTPDALLQYAAVQLFVQRAAAARPGFRLRGGEDAQAAARICRRLDGIPLALELAAARVTMLTLPQIAARLDDRFRLLTGGSRAAIARQRTLQALIDWSYDLLPEAERALLRCLSVFAGGWTLEAAEAVRGEAVDTNYQPLSTDVLDLLSSLEEKSLVQVEEQEGALRCRMLETVREYAREKLRAAGEEEAARRAHMQFFLQMAEGAREALWGSGQEAALAILETEHDNLRAALDWAQGAAPEQLLRLAAALWPFWEARGYFFEGRQHLRPALQRSDRPDAPERAQALLGAARLALQQSDLDEADAFAQEGRERFRSRGDSRGLAAALLCLGEVALARGQFAAEPLFAEGLEACRQSGWAQGSALALVKLGAAAMMLGEHSRARAPLEEALALAETLGDAPTLALAFHERGRLAMWEGGYARAGALLEQSVEIWRRLGYKQATAEALDALGVLAGRQGDRTRAIPFLEQAAATYRELGVRMDLAWTLQEIGNAYCDGGADAQARAAYEESLGIFRELNDWYGIACASNNLGMACFRLGDPARAQALHREALALYGSHETWSHGIAWSLERVGVVTAALGDPWQAARLLGAASAARARYNQEPPGRESHELEHATAALREKLGPEAWESAWQAGRAMPREEAIASALGGQQADGHGDASRSER